MPLARRDLEPVLSRRSVSYDLDAHTDETHDALLVTDGDATTDAPECTVRPVTRMRSEEYEMELAFQRGFELIPKRCGDEAAAEIDVPFELALDSGDRIAATIAKSGTVTIRAVEPEKMFVLGNVTIEGFTPEQAQAVAKGFWGRVWAGIKTAVRAVLEAITFDGGPYLGTCRADVQVTHVDGVPVGATVGIKCAQ